MTTNFGGVDVVPLLGAICSVRWLSGRGAIAGCHCRVPLQGAIAGCHCSVRWLGGGGGDDQLWGSGRGAFDNTKIVFCYLGSMLVKFLSLDRTVLFGKMAVLHFLQ